MINSFADVAHVQRQCMYCPNPIPKGSPCLKIVTQNYKGGSAHGDCFVRFAKEQADNLKNFVAILAERNSSRHALEQSTNPEYCSIVKTIVPVQP